MTDSDRILARGVPISLADGSKANLRFGFLALKQLEDEFGSLAEALGPLQNPSLNKDGLPEGKIVKSIWRVLAAGLLHLQKSDLELDLLLDESRIEEYSEAIGKTIEQGVGKSKGPKGPAETPSSPGTISTISPPSPSAEQMVSSGT